MQIFDTLLVHPLINILVAIYQILTYFHISNALGFSIILITVLIRFILYPFTVSQIKASQKMQNVQPHINRLKEKHKSDPKRMQQEQMALFKEHGINPAAGCLPSLIQIVILLFGFYPAIQKVINLKPKETILVINKILYFDFLKLNHAWDTNFLGLPLGKTPGELFQSIGFLIVLIPIITALLQFIQTKMTIIPPVADEVAMPKKQEPDFAKTMQSQMLYMMPVIIGVVSYQFSIGLSLYWNTYTIFGIIQQYQMQGLGGLSDWVKKLESLKSGK
ncbi:YidC/Oxa1 family membrane protein insertase [Patescibacteria group bacterium]|nr:YidC/Oxa1 family membrane protein insertase [Patescibacteria group bacterium]MBU4098614.1 YidC/Oxa1 family membrane protein insertase [Patescibacteria group bacterium]